MVKLYDVVKAVTPDAPFARLSRVIAFSKDKLGVWLIPVTHGESSYAPRPIYCLRATLEQAMGANKVMVTEWAMPALWLMSDRVIAENAPKRADGRCPALEKRDADWAMIEKLVTQRPIAQILDHRMSYRWVLEIAKRMKVSIKRIYRSIHRYWAGGCNRNALLPLFTACGSRGEVRAQKVKLGRPNRAVKAGRKDLAGPLLTEKDIGNLQFGWEHFKVKGTSVNDAYLETMATFWRAGVKNHEGKQLPVLVPAYERPTRRQFELWGPRGEGNQPARLTQLGHNEWERDYRPLPGTARDGIGAVGDTASLDAVCGDTQLVSVASRLKPVGVLTRIQVQDADTGYIPGFYAGFDAPSGATALQAIANAADSKVDFCARYGITITDDEWLGFAYRKYLADNGELRNELSMEALTAWGACAEYVRSGRAELKPVESDHNSAQASVDHKLPGTTHGRRKERGEEDPVTCAALNHNEYVRQHIKRVLYHNNKEPVPHLLTLEMRQDNVEPTRLAIIKWKLRNGYGTQFQPPVEVLRARLLPTYRAVITRRGLFLLRPDRGNKREIVQGARFVSPYLIESGRMERRRTDPDPVTVNVDPNDLSYVWFATPEGLQKIPNVHPDKLLIERATLHDLLQIQDDDGMKALLGTSQTDQDEIDFNTERDTEAQAAVNAREAEIVAQGQKPSDASLRRWRRANRAVEKQLVDKPRGRPPKGRRRKPPVAPLTPAGVVGAPTESALVEALRGALVAGDRS